MTLAAADQHHHQHYEHETPYQIPPPTLLDVLHNSLIFGHTAPFLPVASLLSLSATCHELRALVHHTPGVFRRLDLSPVRAARVDVAGVDRGGEVWRSVQVDENLTEDDFYSGPLRGIFSTLARSNILRNVQTLVLDGLSVTAELCHDIINDAAYNVRILSIRDVKNLNQAKLRRALQYACRPGRPEETPRLKALYVFGPRDLPEPQAKPAAGSLGREWNQKSQLALSSELQHEGEAWWSRKGRILTSTDLAEWGSCLLACRGIIAFDAVLCTGPRHHNSPAFGKVSGVQGGNEPEVAVYALPPCDGCGTAPEGTVCSDAEPTSLPLLAPPPTYSSSTKVATAPSHASDMFVPRCADCIRERYCTGCKKWWCESCYKRPGAGATTGQVVVVDEEGDWNLPEDSELELSMKIKDRLSKSCWECGSNCDECIVRTQKVCKKCYGGYCLTHNEGASDTCCDWCNSPKRSHGRL
jgi:hypothetical protein